MTENLYQHTFVHVTLQLNISLVTVAVFLYKPVMFCFIPGGNMLFRSTLRSRQSPSKSHRRTHNAFISLDFFLPPDGFRSSTFIQHWDVSYAPPCTFTPVISPKIFLFFQLLSTLC